MATTSTTLDADRLAPAEPGQLTVTWRRFRKHKLALMGLFTLIVLTLLCVTAPLFMPYKPDTLDLTQTFAPASAQHWLGTDDLGRDLLTRLLFAGQISLSVGIACTAIVIVIGTLVGMIAGYFGGWIDTLLMRIVDLLLAIPFFPLLLVLSQMLSQYLDSFTTIVIVLSVFGWLGICRLVRGQILSLRNLDFVEATRALGASNSRIMFNHMLPNSLAPIIVAATLAVGDFIISESALSFLGYGIKTPRATWGNMLSDVNNYFLQHPLLAFYPGLLILITVVSINFMGDALRDALDPRLKM
ncbi:MAG TPA: oligopeptide ABC transporter permease [Chloroflexia bacterium]|nr:oligopeptide ABC transporter permease [Chloroflexia bacterium]